MHTSSLSLAALALLGAMAMTAPALAASAGPDGLNCKDPALQNDARCLDWAKRSGSPWATRPGDAGKPAATSPWAGKGNAPAPAAGTATPPPPPPRDTTRQRRDQTDVTPPPDNGPATNDNWRRRGDMNNNDNFDNNSTGRFDNGRGSNDNGGFDRGNDNGPSFDRGNDNGPSFNRGRDHRSFRDFRRTYDFPRFARPFFDVRPGVVVPRHFRLRPVPREIAFFYPQYRGYLYFVTSQDDVVIVSPRSYRIVAIL